jgi:hypothetical protein
MAALVAGLAFVTEQAGRVLVGSLVGGLALVAELAGRLASERRVRRVCSHLGRYDQRHRENQDCCYAY